MFSLYLSLCFYNIKSPSQLCFLSSFFLFPLKSFVHISTTEMTIVYYENIGAFRRQERVVWVKTKFIYLCSALCTWKSERKCCWKDKNKIKKHEKSMTRPWLEKRCWNAKSYTWRWKTNFSFHTRLELFTKIKKRKKKKKQSIKLMFSCFRLKQTKRRWFDGKENKNLWSGEQFSIGMSIFSSLKHATS